MTEKRVLLHFSDKQSWGWDRRNPSSCRAQPVGGDTNTFLMAGSPHYKPLQHLNPLFTPEPESYVLLSHTGRMLQNLTVLWHNPLMTTSLVPSSLGLLCLYLPQCPLYTGVS